MLSIRTRALRMRGKAAKPLGNDGNLFTKNWLRNCVAGLFCAETLGNNSRVNWLFTWWCYLPSACLSLAVPFPFCFPAFFSLAAFLPFCLPSSMTVLFYSPVFLSLLFFLPHFFLLFFPFTCGSPCLAYPPSCFPSMPFLCPSFIFLLTSFPSPSPCLLSSEHPCLI